MTDRREIILQKLNNSTTPISATAFSKELNVSRQIIVGDIALLRASGHNILATPRGYVCKEPEKNEYRIVCNHKDSDMTDELYTIVDCGCSVTNVIIDHPIYGEITGNLHISSRLDVDEFLEKLKSTNSHSLSFLTDNIHSHTLSCPSDKHFNKVLEILAQKGYLL